MCGTTPSTFGSLSRCTGMSSQPPWRQLRGKWMVSLVNSHSETTSNRWHLWEIDLRFALRSTPGKGGGGGCRERASTDGTEGEVLSGDRALGQRVVRRAARGEGGERRNGSVRGGNTPWKEGVRGETRTRAEEALPRGDASTTPKPELSGY